MLISLVCLPGNGQRDVTLPEGATVADLIAQEGLENRGICVRGTTVPTSDFGTFVLTSGIEVAALTPSKGN